jgi:ornithine decarboxylase
MEAIDATDWAIEASAAPAVSNRNSHLLPLIEASRRRRTPAFWASKERLVENYRRFEHGLPDMRVFYAMKANPAVPVLATLRDVGASFDAASLGEVRTLLRLGVSPDRIAFTTPVKPEAETRRAYQLGVRLFAADSADEVHKLARAAAGSRVLVRLQTAPRGCLWPLSQQFGLEPSAVPELVDLIAANGLDPYGLTFHVGSQTTDPESWVLAIRHCANVWQACEKRGHRLHVLDLGGGFPVEYLEPVPSLEEIFGRIRTEIDRHWLHDDPELWVEPGRAIVADAIVAVTSVIGTVRRNGLHWVFCDIGAFNGLLELIEPSSDGFQYEVWADTGGSEARATHRVTLVGPSCDGDDKIGKEVELPTLREGDRVYFLRAGAYSYACRSPFCGNRAPRLHVV